jgi:hypothetical protein
MWPKPQSERPLNNRNNGILNRIVAAAGVGEPAQSAEIVNHVRVDSQPQANGAAPSHLPRAEGSPSHAREGAVA